jgi:hypothetical protein
MLSLLLHSKAIDAAGSLQGGGLSLLFGSTFGSSQGPEPRGLALGFDVDFEPALWWQRKPRALAPAAAKKKLHKAAEVIVAKAQEQVAAREPAAARKAEVRAAVAPLVQQMPGFDWRAMYDAAYSRALTAAIAQQIRQQDDDAAKALATRKRRMQDDEEIALLLAML